MITQVSPEDSGFYVCSGELDGVSETAEAHLTVVEGMLLWIANEMCCK